MTKIVWFCNDYPSFAKKARGLSIVNKFVKLVGVKDISTVYYPPVRKQIIRKFLLLLYPLLVLSIKIYVRKKTVIYPIGTDTYTADFYLNLFKKNNIKVIPYIVDNVIHKDFPGYSKDFANLLGSFEYTLTVTNEMTEFAREHLSSKVIESLEFPVPDAIIAKELDLIPFDKYIIYSGSLSSEYRGPLNILIDAINDESNNDVGLIITSDKVKFDSEKIYCKSFSFEELNGVIKNSDAVVLLNSNDHKSKWHRLYSFPSKILGYGICQKPIVYIGSNDSWVYSNICEGLYSAKDKDSVIRLLKRTDLSSYVTRSENRPEYFLNKISKMV